MILGSVNRSMLNRIIAIMDDQPVQCARWIMLLMMFITTARYVQSPPRPTDDQTTNWWPVVNDLLDGKGFTQCLPEYFPFCTEDSPTAMREPLPLLAHAAVAGISGRSLWAASLFQAGLNTVSAWLLFLLGRRLVGARAGVLAATIWALYLPAYQDVINIGGDQLATVLLLLAALALERALRSQRLADHLIAGSLFGAASLCRSATIAFAVAGGLGIVLAHGRRGLRDRAMPGIAFACGIAAALLPWAVRNALVFDRVVVGSTLSGYNLFRHNAVIRNEHYLHFVAAEEGRRYLDSLITAHPELTGRENEAEMNAFYRAAGRDVIAAHKGRYLELSAYRLLPLWTNWGVNVAYGKPAGGMDMAVLGLQLLLIAAAVLGGRHAFPGRWLMVIGLALYSLLYAAVVARLRFLIPGMPLVALLAATGLARWTGRPVS